MKKYIGFIFVMMILVIQFGCKKESVDIEGEKLFLSSGMIIPGEVYCDDEFCYWIDTQLWDEPIDIDQVIYGEANKWGRMVTVEKHCSETGRKFMVTEIDCPSPGTKCGKKYIELPNGDLHETGLYLQH